MASDTDALQCWITSEVLRPASASPVLLPPAQLRIPAWQHPSASDQTSQRYAAAVQCDATAGRSGKVRDSLGNRTITVGILRNFKARNICSPPAPGGVR